MINVRAGVGRRYGGVNNEYRVRTEEVRICGDSDGEGLAGTVVREGLSKRRDVCKSIFWREKGTGTIRVRTTFFWLFGLDKQ